MRYGLVLGGGGVRGAFHIGVWKALRKMNIELEAVTGASIGAINGALIAQGEYETAARMWLDISADDIINLPSGMESEKNIFSLKNIAGIAKEIYSNEGLDMSPLEKILRTVLDEDKLRASKVDFGATAFSLTNKKGIYKFRDEIPEGQLIDYIMASASILTARKIDSEKFSDGGMYDNMPVNMLISKGIKDIITVDVQGVGINRSFSDAGLNIIQVSSKNPQTGIMDFDKSGIARSIDEGYIMTLKAFGQATGDIYAFPYEDYMAARGKYGAQLISGVERAAKIFDISNLEMYTFDGLCEMVIDRYYKLAEKDNSDFVSEKVRHENDKALLVRLVKGVESGKKDFLTDALSVFSSVYDAASAILYFKH